MEEVEWGEYKLGDLFSIHSTLSFNTDKLIVGNKYDYITRTSQNQGILQQTSFINKENLNSAGNWSLGLLQMDFFYRNNEWYAGQFVRKIVPKIHISKNSISFFTSVLNKQKKKLLSVLVRDVNKTFLNYVIKLPTKSKKIDFDFIENFVNLIETEYIEKLSNYLLITGLKDFNLTDEETQALNDLENNKIAFGSFTYKNIFNNIKQGRRLKKDDQKTGNIPFVMAGVTNAGVVNYISNPIARFPKNSITIDIFGNTFYRNYDYGAGDDTGVYWHSDKDYSKEMMLFYTTSMEHSILGKFDYGNKLRSSQSLDFTMQLPSINNKPNFQLMETLISAVQKLVIKEVVLYTNNKLSVATD